MLPCVLGGERERLEGDEKGVRRIRIDGCFAVCWGGSGRLGLSGSERRRRTQEATGIALIMNAGDMETERDSIRPCVR